MSIGGFTFSGNGDGGSRCRRNPADFGASRGLSRRLPDRTGNGRDGGRRAAPGRDSAEKKSVESSRNNRPKGGYFQLSTDFFTVASN